MLHSVHMEALLSGRMTVAVAISAYLCNASMQSPVLHLN